MLSRPFARSLVVWYALTSLVPATRTSLAQEAVTANEPATAAADAPPARSAGPTQVFSSDIYRIIATGRNKNQAMTHLDYLTNRIGPRLTGSDALQTACEWTRDMFESFGLENAKLETWAQWPVGFNRGPWFGRMISPEIVELEFSTDAWTAGTQGKQRGRAVMAPRNDEELAAVKDKLAGAWILAAAEPARGRGGRGQTTRPEGQVGGGPRLVQPADRVPESPPTSQPNTRPASDAKQAESQPADAAAATSTENDANASDATTNATPAQAAAEQPAGDRRGRRGGGRRGGGGGAANDPFRQRVQAAYRDAGILGTINRRTNDLLVTGGRRPTSTDYVNNLPTTPQINMTATSYDVIAQRLAAGEDVVLEFDIRNYFKKGPIPIYNVVADIPGGERPDEYVVVGGHIDSWDGATGATDNGTGVATTLEAARILVAAGVRPKRTIRFMLWSGEEQGILGSRAYVEAHPELMPKISGVLVHDLGTQYLSSISGLSFQLADLKEAFAPVQSLNAAYPFRVRTTDSLTSLGSDHRSFVRAGVPAFFWGQSGGGFNYWDSHHSQHDTFDKAVPEYQEHSSIVIALAAYGIANLDHMLPRERVGSVNTNE